MYELKENINIKNLIYEVRGKQVMLDSDLAELYGCTNGTKDIKKTLFLKQLRINRISLRNIYCDIHFIFFLLIFILIIKSC